MPAVLRTSRNHRLQPIITQGHPWMSWERLIGFLAMNGSFDFDLDASSGRATPDSPVRCDAI